MTRRPTVAVVGGGVSGLATAWFLARRSAAHVVLLEAGPELGGKLRTEPLAGMPLESGPDGFLPGPATVELCAELGLGADLVASCTTEAHFWTGGELRPLHSADSPRGEPPPRLLSIHGGLQRLVRALESHLAGVDVRRFAEVEDVVPAPGETFLLPLRSGPAVSSEGVVLAIPAPAAARLLGRMAPGAAVALAGIRYLDLAVVNLVYGSTQWSCPGSGFLVAEQAGLLISGCTWLSAKWPHLASDGLTPVRVTVGGRSRPDWTSMDDAGLVACVHQELTQVLGAGPPPRAARVRRWRPALADPRYLDRDTVRGAQRVAEEAGVLLACGGYVGGGIASCIEEASAVAAQVERRLG